MTPLILALSLGCSPSKCEDDTGGCGLGDTATDTADSGGDSGGDTADSGADSGDSGGDSGDTASSLHGTPPPKAFPAPAFTALNQDGETRTRDDLEGHPTVMWFYPAAGTGG